MTTVNVTLSNGIEAQVRELSLFALIRSGQIPNSLLPLIKGGVTGAPVNTKVLEAVMATPESLREYIDFFIEYAKRSMVSPKLVEGDAGENEISIWDMSDNDYVLVFTRSQFAAKEKAEEVEPFRPEPDEHEDPAGDEPAMAPPTV